MHDDDEETTCVLNEYDCQPTAYKYYASIRQRSLFPDSARGKCTSLGIKTTFVSVLEHPTV